MNTFYASITIEGIQTVIELHYTFVADQITILEYFDRHGDEPDLSSDQLQLICDDIRRYEDQRPLGNAEQQELALAFNGVGGDEVMSDKVSSKQKAVGSTLADECISCLEGIPENECPESKRECGHHCNHSWDQDECCWCGEVFGEVDE